MSFSMGVDAINFTVKLSRKGRFLSSFTRKTGEWDPDARIELRFNTAHSDNADIVWAATIDGAVATWDRHPDDSRAVLELPEVAGWLYFEDVLRGNATVLEVGRGQ